MKIKALYSLFACILRHATARGYINWHVKYRRKKKISVYCGLVVMKFIGGILAFSLAVISCGTFASAAAEKFNLNKDHTYVGFDVSYLVVARVAGQFDDFKGSFVIDKDHPERSRADIIIKTGSVNTGIQSRDDDIRSPGLFNTAHFPTMIFHSRKIAMEPDNTGHIFGDLTLLGVTRPVTMDIARVPGVKHKESHKEKVFSEGLIITGKIRRSDFGMNAYVRPIGNTVTLYVCYNTEQCNKQGTLQKEIKPKYNN